MSAQHTAQKTNAMRILDAAHIPYAVQAYDDNTDHKLENGAALRLAQKLGADPAAVFKTIVMKTDSAEICVFCVPADSEVSIKKARAAAGAKSLEPVKPAQLAALTGYIRGGCSPVGMERSYRTFIDESAILHERIYVSAGVRGMQLCLAPDDLAAAVHAHVCPIASKP